MISIKALAPLVLAMPAAAHIVLWHPSMYGFEPNNIHAMDAGVPLAKLPFNEWWFHGYLNKGPEWQPQGDAHLELPSGGTLNAEISCNKHLTSYYEFFKAPGEEWACGEHKGGSDTGMIHSVDPNGTPLNELTDVKGSAIAIAYKSNPHDIKPEDFVVISTNFSSPYKLHTDYQIPANLPPCPNDTCYCMWGWVHAPFTGGDEMYMGTYRCRVTNANPSSPPIPPPQIARKCPFDRNNCTIGAKQPHYWANKERMNNFQDPIDPPFYNQDYGFTDGAQTDLWELDDGEDLWAETTDPWAPPPYETKTGTWTTTPRDTATSKPTTSASSSAAPTNSTTAMPTNATSSSVPAPSNSTTALPSSSANTTSSTMVPTSSPSANATSTVLPTNSTTAIPSPSANTTSVMPSPTDNSTTSSVEPTATGNTTSVEPTATGNMTSVEPTATGNMTSVEPTATGNTTSVEPTATGNTTSTEPTATGNTTSIEPTVTDTTAPVEPTVTDTTAPVEPTGTDAPVEPTGTDTTAPVEPTGTDTTAPVEPTVTDTTAPVDPTETVEPTTPAPTNTKVCKPKRRRSLKRHNLKRRVAVL